MNKLFIPLRYLYARKLYSLLNICGLGIGLSVCLVLALYVRKELSYEDGFAVAERVYIVGQKVENSTPTVSTPAMGSSVKVKELFSEVFPEVERVTRMINSGPEVLLRVGATELPESGMRYADEEFFRVFDFPVVAGELTTALDRPDGLVLTRALSEKLFGTTDTVGRTLTVDGAIDLVVTAVVDIPGNTHLTFTAMAPAPLYYRTLPSFALDSNWANAFWNHYVLLREGASIESLTARFPAFLAEQTRDLPTKFSFVVTPLTDIHLVQTAQRGVAGLSNLQRVQLFAGIGLCILLIAVVNFMNLATAGASRRAREVGVKLALGTGRFTLIRQFLGESLLMVALAMLLALALAESVVLPLVSGLLQWDLQLTDVPLLQGLSALTGATLLLAVLAGAYPAFYLTAWNAPKVLRGEVTRGRSGQSFRNTLVVVQFTISIALIVATLVMNAQLRFIQTSDKGFDPSNVMTVTLPRDVDTRSEYDVLRERLRSVPGVDDVAFTASSLQLSTASIPVTTPEGPEGVRVALMTSTENFPELFRIPLLAGRYAGSAGVDDSIVAVNGVPTGGVVLNAAAVRLLGWTPEEAIGRTVQIPPATRATTAGTTASVVTGMAVQGTTTTVIGVVRDTVGSARAGIVPMAYVTYRDANYSAVGGGAVIRLTDAADAAARAGVEQVWNELLPFDTVQISFTEERMEAQYAPDRTQMRIFGASATLAVLIACFGLFGLATFNTERRTKEIGVRKVMGGSVWSIVLLLTNDFSKLVLVANVIAWPLAYVAMSRWLENFAHRIDLTPLVFIGSGLIALCIAWVTVGGTAAKAASQKPVLALRYE